MRHQKTVASDKRTDKGKTASGISTDNGGRCAGRAIDEQSVAAKPTRLDTFQAMAGVEKLMATRIRRDAEMFGTRFDRGLNW